MIEVRTSRVVCSKGRYPLQIKGVSAEVWGLCLGSLHWGAREDLAHCHKLWRAIIEMLRQRRRLGHGCFPGSSMVFSFVCFVFKIENF